MNTEKIRLYLAVIESGSYLLAGKKEDYSASGIKRAVSTLESELGTSLLTRKGNHFVPTPKAHELIPLFEEILAKEHEINEISRKKEPVDVHELNVCFYSENPDYLDLLSLPLIR